MADVEVRPVRAAELAGLAELIAAQQSDPRGHVAYLAEDAASIAADLAALEPLGLEGVLVGVADGRIVGALGAEWDAEPPRAWWHGPFVAAGDWDEVADRLLAAGQAMLPESVTEQELAPDDRNTRLAALARRHGFTAEEASVVLARSLDGLTGDEGARHAPGPPIRPLESLPPDRRAAVAALHDRLFSGAHTAGSRLAEGTDRLVLVAGDPDVVGYVAAERQSDGSGYIDFLGVDEAARGAGVGRALVDRACLELARRYGCPRAHLTVRESLGAARRVYERCGFVEERVVRPWRRGFTLSAS